MSFISRIDPEKKRFDSNNWAISLVRVPDTRHAELVIEKVVNNKIALLLVHMEGSGRCNTFGRTIKYLRKYGEVKFVADLTYDSLKYEGKPKTWIKSKESIELMLEEAKKDKQDRTRTPFNIAGSRSILLHDERFRIDTRDANLLYFFNKNTDFNEYDKIHLQIYKINQKIRSQQTIENEKRYKKVLDKCYKELLKVFTDYCAVNFHQSDVLKKVGAVFRLLCFNELETYTVEADNCFTWATKKLKMLDIDVLGTDEYLFATVTNDYTG